MATPDLSHIPERDLVYFELPHRVVAYRAVALPLAVCSLTYQTTKNHSPAAVQRALTGLEAGVETVTKAAVARCEPLLVRADQFSCRQLDSLENTVEAYTSSLGKRAWELSDMVARERREHGTVGASAIVLGHALSSLKHSVANVVAPPSDHAANDNEPFAASSVTPKPHVATVAPSNDATSTSTSSPSVAAARKATPAQVLTQSVHGFRTMLWSALSLPLLLLSFLQQTFNDARSEGLKPALRNGAKRALSATLLLAQQAILFAAATAMSLARVVYDVARPRVVALARRAQARFGPIATRIIDRIAVPSNRLLSHPRTQQLKVALKAVVAPVVHVTKRLLSAIQKTRLWQRLVLLVVHGYNLAPEPVQSVLLTLYSKISVPQPLLVEELEHTADSRNQPIAPAANAAVAAAVVASVASAEASIAAAEVADNHDQEPERDTAQLEAQDDQGATAEQIQEQQQLELEQQEQQDDDAVHEADDDGDDEADNDEADDDEADDDNEADDDDDDVEEHDEPQQQHDE